MTRRLTRILRIFDKAVIALRKLQAKNEKKAAQHDVAIGKLFDEMDSRALAIAELNAESRAAESVAKKIEALVSPEVN